MYKVELSFDPGRHLFSAAVVVLLRSSPGTGAPPSGPPSAGALQPVEMYVDTGSSASSITEDVAVRLGLHIEGLPKERIGGLGGFPRCPVASDIDFALAGKIISLDKVVILEPFREKVRTGKGVFKREGMMEHPPINLIGLDALAKLKARLVIDSAARRGWLEID